MKRASLLLAILMSSACAHVKHASAPNPTPGQWDATLAAARAAADSGKYESADNTLSDFIALHNGSPEATEAVFWRGVFKVDPANKGGSLSAGISGLDAYLASGPTSDNVPVARALRRTAALAQSLKLASPGQIPTTVAPTADKDAMKSRDEEIASLRDQLAKVNAELERIKKRLANPKA